MNLESLKDIMRRGAEALSENGEADRIALYARGAYDTFVASGKTPEEVQAMMLQLLFGYDDHARTAASVLMIACGVRAREDIEAALKERDENAN